MGGAVRVSPAGRVLLVVGAVLLLLRLFLVPWFTVTGARAELPAGTYAGVGTTELLNDLAKGPWAWIAFAWFLVSGIGPRHPVAGAPSAKEVVKIKCRNCGSLEAEDAAFCRKCGQPIWVGSQEPEALPHVPIEVVHLRFLVAVSAARPRAGHHSLLRPLADGHVLPVDRVQHLNRVARVEIRTGHRGRVAEELAFDAGMGRRHGPCAVDHEEVRMQAEEKVWEGDVVVHTVAVLVRHPLQERPGWLAGPGTCAG